MKTVKRIAEATFHLFFFKPYTVFHRSTEIIFGVLAWAFLALILNSIFVGP